jgi:hypothetical protein
MADQVYNESVYKFTDPVRLFKENDPYYFEVDNIPLKQLQENCLWLKDQIRRDVIKISNVKRADIDELRPYASGGDRLVRVNPGRYSARINDVGNKRPLAYLRRIIGEQIAEMDTYEAALPNPGIFNTATQSGANYLLEQSVNTFKSTLAQDALGMNGLAERSFTWPVVTPDTPVNVVGAVVSSQSDSNALGYDSPGLGTAARISPMLVTEALIWAKSRFNSADRVMLPTFDVTVPSDGFATLPRTENFFVKRWRGVSRTAIVDVPQELSIEVPAFDPADFSYVDESGNTVQVENVVNRIDMVFIYSKPVDASSTTILKSTGKETITTPTLGIVRGAGLRANFFGTQNYDEEYIEGTGTDHKILASPGDAENANIGFTAASGNDVAYDIRGSFPSPDDILNIAPLISEKLESTAFELIGQSILPVAYVWVTNTGSVVSTTDVIDIRPLFRTAELTYNERAGIAAAMPQLSLANPAVGKQQMDYELKRQYDNIDGRLQTLEVVEEEGLPMGIRTVAAGYVFGGWNFGPEGAMYDFYRTSFGNDPVQGNESEQAVKAYIRQKYGLSRTGFQIPAYPDWDLATWAQQGRVDDPGKYPNDYINTVFSQYGGTTSNSTGDSVIVGGSSRELVNEDGTNAQGNLPARAVNFLNTSLNFPSRVQFNYISKRIEFDRSNYPGMIDYTVDLNLVNSVALSTGARGLSRNGIASNDEIYLDTLWAQSESGQYFGTWVEKGEDYFIIYVAFPNSKLKSETNNPLGNFLGLGGGGPFFPAPHRYRGGGPGSSAGYITASERGGERFSNFLVMVDDILKSNQDPQALATTPAQHLGYEGNPRVGKCTYPTVSWSIKAITPEDQPFFAGNLRTNNEIALNQN